MRKRTIRGAAMGLFCGAAMSVGIFEAGTSADRNVQAVEKCAHWLGGASLSNSGLKKYCGQYSFKSTEEAVPEPSTGTVDDSQHRIVTTKYLPSPSDFLAEHYDAAVAADTSSSRLDGVVVASFSVLASVMYAMQEEIKHRNTTTVYAGDAA